MVRVLTALDVDSVVRRTRAEGLDVRISVLVRGDCGLAQAVNCDEVSALAAGSNLVCR
jgi:hypothetical protein